MERGNRLMRAADRYLGVPLMPAAALFRKITRPNAAEIKTAGIICLGAIGDLLLCCGLVNGLKAAGLRVELVTTKANAQASKLLTADESFSFKASDIKAIVSHLRSRHYDLLLDTTQWARIGSVASAFSGAGRTVGFRSEGEYRSLPYDIKIPHRPDIHESENFLNLARAVFPDIQGDMQLALVPAAEHSGNYIVCHMWGTGTCAVQRQWDREKWANLTSFLLNSGFNVYFTGSAADKKATDDFIDKYFKEDKRVQSAAGRFDLMALGGFLLQSCAVVSVNTGIMHYAALLGVPTVGFHGPTNPLRWRPIGKRTVALCPGDVAHIPLKMSEAARDEHTWTRRITVEEVTIALSELGILNEI